MKPTILSTLLFITFGTYTLFERSGGVDAIYVAPKQVNEGKEISVLFSRESDPALIPKDTEVTTKTTPAPVAEKPRTTPPVESTPIPTPPPIKAAPATPAPVPVKTSGLYRDGEYVGNSADAYYGFVQVKAIIQNGKIADVQFLSYPNDQGTSIEINTQAMPYLKIEAIQAQSAQVDTVSGASETSGAFRESLATALAKAKV